MRLRLSAILVSVVLVGSYSAAQNSPDTAPKAGPKALAEKYRALVPPAVKEGFKKSFPYMSWSRARALAEVLGVTEIDGRPLASPSFSTTEELLPNETSTNTPIDVEQPMIQRRGSRVAANPHNPNHLIVAAVYQNSRNNTNPQCVFYSSSDAGKTWNGPVTMPLQGKERETCADPSVAFAPDGTRIYYVYTDVWVEYPTDQILNSADIMLSYSDDGGSSWTGPVFVFRGEPTVFDFLTGNVTPGTDYDTARVSVPHDETGNNRVYVATTRYEWGTATDTWGQVLPYLQRQHVVFTRSDERGYVGTWNAPVILDSTPDHPGDATFRVFLQGAVPAGGWGGDVLVAWYNSNGPNILPGVGATPPDDPLGYLENSFIIRTSYSSDYGETFGPIVNAAVDDLEVDLFLGPVHQYMVWLPAMFPDVAVAPDGSAHVVYTHTVNRDLRTAENGDVRYVGSSGQPYEIWSMPETVNDDGLERAQGMPSIAIVGTSLYVAFFDARLSPDAAANSLYDIFGARKEIGSTKWENFRVTDASSAVPWENIGNQGSDVAGTDFHIFFGWIDRRQVNIWRIFDANIFGQVYKPVATLGTILPASASAGGPAFTLTLNGSSFSSGSVVLWNGSNRTTNFVNSTQLTASIPASDVASGGFATVTVYTPGAPGSATSTKAEFSVSDYSLGLASDNLTVTAGQAASYTVIVAPSGGSFDRAVSLSCSGVPNLAACSFSPPSVTPNGSPVSSTLTISTTAPQMAVNTTAPEKRQRSLPLFAFLLPVSAIGLVIAGGGLNKRRCWLWCSLFVLLLLVILGLVGCGSEATTPRPATSSQPGTPPGTYTITISGASGSLMHTQSVVLTVR